MRKCTSIKFSAKEATQVFRKFARVWLAIFLLTSCFSSNAQEHSHEETDLRILAEDLWFEASKELASLHIPESEKHDFYVYASEQLHKEKILFFLHVFKGLITEENLDKYINNMRSSRKEAYQKFLRAPKDKKKPTPTPRPGLRLKSDEACYNMGFETGTFVEWEGALRNRHIGNQAFPEVAIPGPWEEGFNQHCIMTPDMTDPLIPDLPVVAPGRTNAVRLGNTIGGGHLATLRRTFTVDSSNMIFTYRYAVVLDDPADARGHGGLHRPHFNARLIGSDGEEIGCTGYSVVVEPNLPDYIRTCVGMDWAMDEKNIGCPPENVNDGAAHYNPHPRNGCRGNNLDIYYKNWSTVSMVLNEYIGQEVTIEFTAADCVPGAHLGYAYVDTECAPLNLSQTQPICSGTEERTIEAPEGFESYSWSGPGIVSGENEQVVTVNRSGTYTVTIMPISDNPCPTELEYVVEETCPPRAYNASVCETELNTLEAENIDLSNYESLITENGLYGEVIAWHTELPANNANLIIDHNITVQHQDTVYAISSFEDIRTDTVPLAWTVQNMPEISFPDQEPLCEGSNPVTIENVTPQGGTYFGDHTTESGTFNPEEAGVFTLSYTYTTEEGCSDTATNTIEVIPPPIVNAGNDLSICATEQEVVLSADSANATSLQWSGSGNFSPDASSISPTYAPSEEEKSNGIATLTLTATGIAPCPVITDTVSITIVPEPRADAGEDQLLCSDVTMINLEGFAENHESVTWTGGSGSFSPNDQQTTTYTLAPGETEHEYLTLTLTVARDSLCDPAYDEVEIRFALLPTADAGPDTNVCANNAEVNLSGTITNAPESIWSGGHGSFSPSPNVVDAIYHPTEDEANTGQVTLTLSTTGSEVCPDVSNQVTIQIYPSPNVDAGPPVEICANEEQLTLQGTASNASNIIWSGGAGSFSPLNEASTTYTVAPNDILSRVFTLTLTAEEEGCLPESDETTITIHPFPELETPNMTTCEGEEATITTTNIPGASYLWNSDNGSTSNEGHTLNVLTEPGEQEFQVTVTSPEGCTATDSMVLKGVPHPIISVNDTATCVNKDLRMIVELINEDDLDPSSLSFQWTKDNQVVSNSHDFYTTAIENFTTEITVSNGCPTTEQASVTVHPVPTGDLGRNHMVCREEDEFVTLDPGEADAYLWHRHEDSSRTLEAKDPGLYQVTLANEFGCETTLETEVREVCPPSLHISNAFSPNGDGSNDKYTVYHKNVTNFQMLIFNRWGEIIFESVDPDEAWDGYYRGDPMPVGVYPWRITYEGNSEEYRGPYKKQGSVTLIR
ncbi:gliding motility-associated C-terminal domain-containing protein [Cytophagaceae bacterium ABcell3]|nr:gliding motility-associated C-terminal domain-containing protein [Cytophagaceae bacterium ABcell3]